ncbi:unnamed protein product [Phytophthora lilii]|uniref:Hexose transporter 1 n=1 Tax=Phytophthora lilii TaxID=2077276 RepID=A0A9W6U239_9STRA|nr:unnamed protein product [Phytophthora lilii]
MAAGVVVNVHNSNDGDDVPTEGSRTYAIIVCIFAALGGLFFGYDQGVTSGVLIMRSFLEDYCVGWHNFTYHRRAVLTLASSELPSEWTSFTVWYNLSYNLGCLAGAFLGGVIADKLGRRATIFSAGLLFCVEEELAAAKGLSELLDPPIRKRVAIDMFLQVLQQATGINPIMSYGALIFQDITNAGIYSAIFLSGVNFLSTIPAMRWVDTFGRRQLLLIGAVGMVLGHLFAAILFSIICNGDVNDAGCPKVGGWSICLGTAFFVFNFAISWGPVCWIYPAEIFPLSVRAPAVSLSTAANWAMAALMTEVVKLFPYLNINGVFFLFAALCALSGIFIFFFCPETKGLMLEDIEALFQGSARQPLQSAVRRQGLSR